MLALLSLRVSSGPNKYDAITRIRADPSSNGILIN